MHYRKKENETILPFYLEHAKCAKNFKGAVITVLDQNGADLKCFDTEAEGGYKDLTVDP